MRRLLAVLLLALLAAMLFACGTAVPDVKGMTSAQATKSLERAGFQVGRVIYDVRAAGAVGAVVAQKPMAGARAGAGSMVVLTVAGPQPVVTPDLAGLTQVEASAALGAVGLIAGQASSSFDSSVAAGRLVSQEPSVGSSVPRGSTVALILSRGPAPVQVPWLKGKTLAEARAALASAGLKIQVKTSPGPAKKGTVTSQSRSGEAAPGSVVVVTVSTGAVLVTVPNIQGMLDPDPVLRRAGLRPKGIPIHGPIESDAAGFMEAYRQHPRAGSRVPRGTAVTYHFWWERG